MKSSKYAIALILLVPIGLVAGPVLRAGLRSEVAHWYLAAAANALELGQGKPDSSLEADRAIASARAWDPEIGKLPDYLSVRLRQFQSHETDLTLAEIFKDVPEDSRLHIAEQLAEQYFVKGEFDLAAEVMQVLLGEQAKQQVFFWQIMVYRDLTQVSESRAVQTLKDAIAINPDNAKLRTSLAQELTLLLVVRDDFASSLETYKLWLGETFDRTKYNLNSLAYARALANEELDQALVDINEALSYRVDDYEKRDTRALVYYHLGRYEEALVDADYSVKASEASSMWSMSEYAMDWLQGVAEKAEAKSQRSVTDEAAAVDGAASTDGAAGQGSEPVAEIGGIEGEPPIVMLDPPKNYLTRRSAKPSIWTRGVIRYHRAMILEKLGRTEEAEADWKWLEDNRLPPDERLH